MADIPTLAEMLLGRPEEPEEADPSRPYQVNIRINQHYYAQLLALSEIVSETKTTFTRMLFEAAIKEFVASLPDGEEQHFEVLLEKNLDGLQNLEDSQ